MGMRWRRVTVTALLFFIMLSAEGTRNASGEAIWMRRVLSVQETAGLVD
jgi:hypothetical protein